MSAIPAMPPARARRALFATTAVLALAAATLLVAAPPAMADEGASPLMQATGPALPAPDPEAAVRAAVARFASAWYEGNATRMSEVLHPDFVRHVVVHAPDLPDGVETQTGLAWLDLTDRGNGRTTAPSMRRAEVVKLDLAGGLADVTLQLADRVERLQLVRWNHGWRVLHALAERDAPRASK